MKKILLTAPLYVLISVAQADLISDSFKQVGDGFKTTGNEMLKGFENVGSIFRKKPYTLPGLNNGAHPQQVCEAATQDKANDSCVNMSADDAIPLYFICPYFTTKWATSKCKATFEAKIPNLAADIQRGALSTIHKQALDRLRGPGKPVTEVCRVAWLNMGKNQNFGKGFAPYWKIACTEFIRDAASIEKEAEERCNNQPTGPFVTPPKPKNECIVEIKETYRKNNEYDY